jgi:dihydroorotase
MWKLLREGTLTHVSTDHAPSTRAQKDAGIWDAPFGLPGLDTTLPFLLDAAHRDFISLEQVVRLYAEEPARRYGLHSRKGHIAPGADADLILVDDSLAWTVDDDEIISKAGWSPYAGRTFIGGVVATYLRGRLIAEGGRPADERSGRFLPGSGSPG